MSVNILTPESTDGGSASRSTGGGIIRGCPTISVGSGRMNFRFLTLPLLASFFINCFLLRF